VLVAKQYMLRWWYDPGWRIVLELSILSMQYMNKIVKFNSNKKKMVSAKMGSH